MEFFNDLVRYSYLNHAFWACILSGITCGIIGTYVVCRRLVFLSGGITHASFGGLGIAFYLGANPIAGCDGLRRRSRRWASNGPTTAGAYPRGFGHRHHLVGRHGHRASLFMSLRPGYASGDLLELPVRQHRNASPAADVAGARRSDARDHCRHALFWLRPVMYVAFDRDFARSQGIPTRLISYAMAALVAVTIVTLDPHHGHRAADLAADHARRRSSTRSPNPSARIAPAPPR